MKTKQTNPTRIYRKVSVEDRLPQKEGLYFTIEYGDRKESNCFNKQLGFHGASSMVKVTHWLEEVELPSEEEVSQEANRRWRSTELFPFKQGASFILNHIKGGG